MQEREDTNLSEELGPISYYFLHSQVMQPSVHFQINSNRKEGFH